MSAASILGARLAGEQALALELALQVWRESRSPAVADAVGLLDSEAAGLYLGHRGTVRVHFHKAWLAVAASQPGALQVGWLARTLTDRLPPDEADRFRYVRLETRAFLERLEALQEFEPDPRLAAALGRFLVERPLYAREQREVEAVYGGALQLMIRMEDVRQIFVCDAIEAEETTFADEARRYLAQRVDQAREALASVPRQQLPDAEQWAAMHPRDVLPDDGSSGEELLAAIYQDPDDDGARMVYADWLQERSDPRGEFIALQMSRGEKDHKRMAALLRTYKSEWLGPDLSQVFYNIEFERGFLSAATIEQNARASRESWAQAVFDPRLSTLQTLWKGKGNTEHLTAFLSSPHALGLRRIELPMARVLSHVADLPHGEQRRLQRLELTFVTRRALLAKLAKAACFRELSCLSYRLSADQLTSLLAELEGYPLPDGLDTVALRYPVGGPSLGAWWAGLRGTVQNLVVDSYGGSFRIRREGKGTLFECPPQLAWGEMWSVALSTLRSLREELGPDEEITTKGLGTEDVARVCEHDLDDNLKTTFI